MKHLIFPILLCSQLISIGLAVELEEWKNYAPNSDAALKFGREYAEQHQNDLNQITQLADILLKDHRIHDAINLYQAALTYNPNHRGLLYRLGLAKSDLQETNSLKSFNHQQHKKFSSVNLRKLDEIKCQTLRSNEGKDACKRLGKERHPLEIAKSTYTNSVEKTTCPAVEINKPFEIEEKSVPNNITLNAFNDIEIGDFHALVIGNNHYKHFPKLETAVFDAKAVAGVLKNKYEFKVTELNNASRYEIFRQLSQLRKQLNSEDNLLIYYAGHGHLDEDIQRGYWLPVDAEEDNYANWVSTNDITDMLNGMSAKHVLVVADSCYSGTLTRSAHIPLHSPNPSQFKWLQHIAKKKSRTVMTSGGLEPVLDSGGGNHSVFTKAFIDALIKNQSVLEASQIFASVRRFVMLNADQTPEYADIRKAGHEGGDFIFMRKK